MKECPGALSKARILICSHIAGPLQTPRGEFGDGQSSFRAQGQFYLEL
jgi:hypothetical protein